MEDQVTAAAQPVPALLERRDSGVAAANFEGDGAGRKGLPQLADSRANFSICEFRRRISEEARRSATAALISGIRAQRSSFVIKRWAFWAAFVFEYPAEPYASVALTLLATS